MFDYEKPVSVKRFERKHPAGEIRKAIRDDMSKIELLEDDIWEIRELVQKDSYSKDGYLLLILGNVFSLAAYQTENSFLFALGLITQVFGVVLFGSILIDSFLDAWRKRQERKAARHRMA